MKFLVDAQLPRRIVQRLKEMGYDAVHTLDLPAANRTPDAEIVAAAEKEQRVVVTKDADFVHSFLSCTGVCRNYCSFLQVIFPTPNWRRCCFPLFPQSSMALHLRLSLNLTAPA